MKHRAWSRWTPERIAAFEQAWADKSLSIDQVADRLGTSRGALYVKANQLQLGRRPGSGQRRGHRPSKPPRTGDVTRQRRFSGVAESDGPKVVLAPYDPRARAGITIFPTSLLPASMRDRIIKSGKESRKLGSRMAKGRWSGQPVYALTLEERATCPRSCTEWLTCYGNNMPFAHRTSDDGTLTRRLWGELASLNAAHPGGFVLRLHVLGDFYSVDYVDFWEQALLDFPALNIFGFTARAPGDPIGDAIAELRAFLPDRFMIRLSGGEGDLMAAQVVDRAEDATGILCPAESNPERCCATCGLCMQSRRTISFIRH